MYLRLGSWNEPGFDLGNERGVLEAAFGMKFTQFPSSFIPLNSKFNTNNIVTHGAIVI